MNSVHIDINDIIARTEMVLLVEMQGRVQTKFVIASKNIYRCELFLPLEILFFISSSSSQCSMDEEDGRHDDEGVKMGERREERGVGIRGAGRGENEQDEENELKNEGQRPKLHDQTDDMETSEADHG